MRIYVAGKYEDAARVREVQQILREAGHQITYDWTTNEQVSAEQAAADMRGVRNADATVVVACEDLLYKGTYVEMGMALAFGQNVYVLGDAIDRCIFTKLPTVVKGIDALL